MRSKSKHTPRGRHLSCRGRQRRTLTLGLPGGSHQSSSCLGLSPSNVQQPAPFLVLVRKVSLLLRSGSKGQENGGAEYIWQFELKLKYDNIRKIFIWVWVQKKKYSGHRSCGIISILFSDIQEELELESEPSNGLSPKTNFHFWKFVVSGCFFSTHS